MASNPSAVQAGSWGRPLRVVHRPPAVVLVSLAIISAAVIMAIAAPFVAPQDPNAIHLAQAYAAPHAGAIFGADSAGRDILSRLIYGARLSLLGPILVIVVAALVGVPLGLLAGYVGGATDAVVSRAADVMFAIPGLLLAILIVATFGAGFTTAVIAVAITYVPLMARVVRSGALVERSKAYVDACRLEGFGVVRICGLHIAPNLTRLIVSQVAVYFAYAVLDLAALSFLGLGTQPPTPDWGNMLANANQGIFNSPTGVIPASVAIVLVVVSVSLIADWVAERGEGPAR